MLLLLHFKTGNYLKRKWLENYALGLIIPPSKNKIIKTAYEHLIEVAQKNYSGNIDIININIDQGSREEKWAPFADFWGVYTYNASGVVVINQHIVPTGI